MVGTISILLIIYSTVHTKSAELIENDFDYQLFGKPHYSVELDGNCLDSGSPEYVIEEDSTRNCSDFATDGYRWLILRNYWLAEAICFSNRNSNLKCFRWLQMIFFKKLLICWCNLLFQPEFQLEYFRWLHSFQEIITWTYLLIQTEFPSDFEFIKNFDAVCFSDSNSDLKIW